MVEWSLDLSPSLTYTTYYRIDQSLVGISKNLKKNPQLLKHAPIRLGTSLGRKSTLQTHPYLTCSASIRFYPSHEVRGREPLMAPPTKCTKQQGGSALAATTSRHISIHLNPWLHEIHCQQRTLENFRNTYPASFSLSLFLFPAVFDCCEHPLICPCLWKIHWTTGHLTQLLCLGSLLSLVSANSNSHGPQQQPQSTAVYVYLCLLQRLSHLSPLASAPPCPA